MLYSVCITYFYKRNNIVSLLKELNKYKKNKIEIIIRNDNPKHTLKLDNTICKKHKLVIINEKKKSIGELKSIKYLLKKAEQAKERRQPIIIFPQGTRTMPGSYYPYQPGVAALYRTLNLPVVPVALNSGLFWPRRSLKLNPGIITVQFLPTIQPGLDRKSFLAKLEKCIESANKILDSAL